MRKLFLFVLSLFYICTTTLFAQDTKLDNLLEKVQQATTQDEKKLLITQLKEQLFQRNKKARDESNAIIEAKKKIPSKLFKHKEENR